MTTIIKNFLLNEKKHLVIVGAGKIGGRLARLAVKNKHDVVIIEKDETKAKLCDSGLDATCIIGDATDLKTLEDAEIEKAGALVITVADDSTNLMIVKLAKSMGIKNITALVSKSESLPFFIKEDVNVVQNPIHTVVDYLFKNVLYPGFLERIEMGKLVDIIKIKLPKNSIQVGKMVGELKLTRHVNIIYIERQHDIITPLPKTKLEEGDKIVLLAKVDKIEDIFKLFKKEKKKSH